MDQLWSCHYSQSAAPKCSGLGHHCTRCSRLPYWDGQLGQAVLMQIGHQCTGLKAVMPLEAAAGPAKLSMSLVCEATTEGCKAALQAAGECPTLTCGVTVEPSQAPVTLVILLGDDELQARVRGFLILTSVSSQQGLAAFTGLSSCQSRGCSSCSFECLAIRGSTGGPCDHCHPPWR